MDTSFKHPIYFHDLEPLDAVEDLLAFTQLKPDAKRELRNLYAQVTRSYHGLNHIAFLWRAHNKLSFALDINNDSLRIYQLIANFIACHDALMFPASLPGVSERCSADWWKKNNTINGSSAEKLVETTILASADHLRIRPTDTNDTFIDWCLGLDLLPLAAPSEMFRLNTLMLRGENAHLSDEQWNTRRCAFFKSHFDEAPAIFRNSYLHSIFEDQARTNIKRVLDEFGG
jgi:predicted metal-dependent HD superfamily phosphohydrolase